MNIIFLRLRSICNDESNQESKTNGYMRYPIGEHNEIQNLGLMVRMMHISGSF